MTNDSHKARLAALVQELSVIHEKVILASGRESDFYVDMRRSTLHHEAAPLIGHVMLDLLEESGFSVGEEYVAVGGLTMAPTRSPPRCCTPPHRVAWTWTLLSCVRSRRTTV